MIELGFRRHLRWA